MTDLSLNATRDYEPTFGDYVALLKPRVMSLVVFTALVGLVVAPVPVHPMIGFAAILFIALSVYAAYRSTRRAAVPVDSTASYVPIYASVTSVGLEYAQEVAAEGVEEEPTAA